MALDGEPAVRHAFFTRQGGSSGGLFASLNCGFGSGDKIEHVERNRGVAASRLDVAPERLVSCHQVHGTNVVTVEQPWRREVNPRADGMVTRVPGIALGVLAADCAPVLFADPEAGIVAAAHGGWRGAVAGVMEATVAAMTGLGARSERIRAGIGPCIAQPSYEVGPEFEAAFAKGDRQTLRPLLNDEVFTTFDQTIKGREARKESVRFTLVGYKDAKITHAAFKGRTAEITVSYSVQFVSSTTNSEGAVIEGDPSAVRDVTDVWTFSRDVRGSDPNWTLVATSGGEF